MDINDYNYCQNCGKWKFLVDGICEECDLKNYDKVWNKNGKDKH